jgi:hypothetical protein
VSEFSSEVIVMDAVVVDPSSSNDVYLEANVSPLLMADRDNVMGLFEEEI